MIDGAKTEFVVEIDGCELAVRMAEAVAGMRRPPQCETAEQALAAMGPDVRAAWMRATDAVMEYLRERVDNMQRVH